MRRSRASSSTAALGKPAVTPAQQAERKALQIYLRVGSSLSLPTAPHHQEPGRTHTHTHTNTHTHTHTHTHFGEPRNKNEARKAVERKLLGNSRAVLDVFRSGEDEGNGSTFSAGQSKQTCSLPQTTKTTHGGACVLPVPQPTIDCSRCNHPATHTHTHTHTQTGKREMQGEGAGKQEQSKKAVKENSSGAAGQP